jgi:uncharacterized membrane protein YuzA (DUF378 family)
MMVDQKTITLVVQIVLILAAVNWGVVAYNGMDLVRMVSMGFDKHVKIIVGVVGVYAAYQLYLTVVPAPQEEVKQ